MPKRLIEREADLEYSISKRRNPYYIITNLIQNRLLQYAYSL